MICWRMSVSGRVMSTSTSGLFSWLVRPSFTTSGKYLKRSRYHHYSWKPAPWVHPLDTNINVQTDNRCLRKPVSLTEAIIKSSSALCGGGCSCCVRWFVGHAMWRVRNHSELLWVAIKQYCIIKPDKPIKSGPQVPIACELAMSISLCYYWDPLNPLGPSEMHLKVAADTIVLDAWH